MPFDGPDAHTEALLAAARALRPRVALWPSEWAQKHRVLTGEGSANPGKWRNERVPFAKAPMDALDERHPAWLVVYMASRQVVKSEVGMNWVGQIIDEQPAPTSILFPGTNLGKSWARLRLNPMIAASPTLSEKIPVGRRSDKTDTLMQKMFPGGHLTIGSTYIATDMSSRAIGKLIVDDADRFQREEGTEGDWLEIALMGLATFGFRRKVYLNSSPGIESLSVINPWWLRSSQGHYHAPCVHCGAMQYFVWDQLKWAEGKPEQAAYECNHCARLIQEHHKTDMLAAGEWRHDFPELESEIIGFHANCLMTPIGLGYTWGEHAKAWERSKRDPAKAKVFINTRLGETHKDPNEKLDWEMLYARRSPYKLRTIPVGCLLLTAGVDVQKNRLELQVVGWGRNERAWVIDYRIFEGDPTRDDVWLALDEVLKADFLNSFGARMRISAVAVDSGFLQPNVFDFTRPRRHRNVFATKGTGRLGRPVIGRPTHIDVKHRGKSDARGAEHYAIGEATAKAWLHERMRADAGTADRPVLPDDRHVQFSDELGEEYFRQLAAEVFDPHKRRFVAVYERNEALDTFIGCICAAMHHSTMLHRLREADWLRLESLYEPKGETKPEPAAVLGETPLARRGGGFLPISAKVKN